MASPSSAATSDFASSRASSAMLGLLSLGLGFAELVSPRQVARAAGTRTPTALVRLHGLRELAAGIGLLTSDQPQRWLWARVVGDAIDLATVAWSPALKGAATRRRAALMALGGIAAIDLQCAMKASGQSLTALPRFEGPSVWVDKTSESLPHPEDSNSQTV